MRKAALTLVSAGALLAGAVAPTTAQAGSGSGSYDFWSQLFGAITGGWHNGGNQGGGNDGGMGKGGNRVPTLRGTKCWKFKAAFGKPSFIELHFFNRRHGHSLISGTVRRSDGVNKKPDRILQVSGSAGYHTFVGDNNTSIERYLLNLTYSYSKTGTDPAKAFSEVGFHIRGHYNVRLNADTLDGVFAGNDFVLRWAPPLTGPARTFGRDESATGADGVTSNYMGSIDCSGRSCGELLPLNNAGSWELVGTNKRQCDNAKEQFGPNF